MILRSARQTPWCPFAHSDRCLARTNCQLRTEATIPPLDDEDSEALLTAAIFAHRSRRTIFERGDARGAGGLRRNEQYRSLASAASSQHTLAEYKFKEFLLFSVVNAPEAKITFVGHRFSASSMSYIAIILFPCGLSRSTNLPTLVHYLLQAGRVDVIKQRVCTATR